MHSSGANTLKPHPYRARLYRIVLGLAALYNLGFAIWAGLWPHSFFDLFGMAAPLYPAVWQCLGMVIGLYGLAYAYASLHLDLARPFVAIGLLGKVIGPVGWLLTVKSGEWPARTFTLIVFNDLVWWLPFSLFLLEGTRLGDRLRSSAPYVCALLNAAAALALLFLLRGGTELVAGASERAAFISNNLAAWRGGWALWMGAALSLLGFYAWWGARLPRPAWAVAAFAIAALGLACDLLAESLYIGWLPADLEALQRAGTLLTSGAANGLYTVGGIVLTLGSRSLRGGLLVWTWAVWASGLLLTASALAGSVLWMATSGGVLMTLFPPWVVVIGLKLKALPSGHTPKESRL